MNTHQSPMIAGIMLCLLMLMPWNPLPAQVTMVQAFPNLTFSSPVDIQNSGDGTNRLFVVERAGVIRVFPNSPGVTSAKIFLNISDLVRSGGELGLLGLAFHPDYETNRYFYVNYTAGTLQAGNLRSVISRFQVSSTNPDSALRSSQLILFEIAQPYENHNGGQIAFGPDGYLYTSLGDGGSGGDPQNNGQKLTTLLGKIVRINVDSTQGALPYAIPPDNPFVGNINGYREEIFAYGFRNPWRFSFDPQNGRLWCADVGQNLWEEIDTVVNGGNYGWRIMEGFNCYNPSIGCNTAGLKLPVYTYSHDSGCSVTGGYVYRGVSLPSLYGKYIFTDYCQGDIFALAVGGGTSPVNQFVLSSGQSISSFGIDEAGEIYLCNIFSGRIYTFTEPNLPSVPLLVAPANGATSLGDTTFLQWQRTGIGHTAHLRVATDPLFQQIVIDDSLLTDTAYFFIAPQGQPAFYWKVRAKNAFGYSAFSDPWSFTVGTFSSAVVTILRSWNLVSLPLRVPDSSTTSVYPSATSEAFQYSSAGGYTSSPVLEAGRGYWLKFPDEDTLMMYGDPITEDTILVEPGWNVIGSITAPVSVSSIIEEPPGNIASSFFAYEGGYLVSTSLLPGRGYWVKVQTSGILILRSP